MNTTPLDLKTLPLTLPLGKVAMLAGLDPKTVSRAVAEGLLRPIRLHSGGRPRFRRDDVLRWLGAAPAEDSYQKVAKGS